MARMAGGDRSALFELYSGFGDQIGRMLRSEFRRLGMDRIDPAEVDGLVLDACIDLSGRAGSWDPTRGVTPWTWAQFRLRNLVVAHLGQFTDVLPEEGPAASVAVLGGGGPGRGSADLDAASTLRNLAGRRPDLRLLQEGLDRVSAPPQQAILLEVKVQAALGDPSPAVTVSQMTGIRPDTVRQIVKRILDRLCHLAAADPRFAPLADLPLLGLAA
jgi:hypothetical protein